MRKQWLAAPALPEDDDDTEMHANSDYFSMLQLGAMEHSRDELRAFLKGYRWMQDEWSSRGPSTIPRPCARRVAVR